MIDKLRKYGKVGGKVIEWFESYLKSRTQKVKYDDILSQEVPVKFGVPQGSKI